MGAAGYGSGRVREQVVAGGARRSRAGRWSGAVVAVGVAGLLAACTSSPKEPAASTKSTKGDEAAADRLYVLDAASGTASPDGDTTIVSLKLDDDGVAWFQDRPDRGHGTLSAERLVADWDDLGLAGDPPNAVIAPEGGSAPVAMSITAPRFDAASSTLRFTGTPDRGAGSLPKEFAGTSVVIDGVPASESPGGSASREFAQRAGSVQIRPLDGGRFSLVLAEASPRTTWVTDRPQRGAGSIATQSFVDRWGIEGFTADPPNAELVVGSGDDAQRASVELSSPAYDAKAGTVSYQARALPRNGASPFDATEVPELDGAGSPATLFIDGASQVEAQFGQECGQRDEWQPAHKLGGQYIIEAWGAQGGRGGNNGGPGGSGGYTIARVDATVLDIVAAGQPVTVAVGCPGGDGGTVSAEDRIAFSRGSGGGGGGATAVRIWDTQSTNQTGCVPGRVWIVAASTNCNIFAVAGGGGGGGGATQGFSTSAGGAGGYRGPVGSDGGTISGFNQSSTDGGGGGGSSTAPTAGRCGSWVGGGNAASCQGTDTQGFPFDATGSNGSAGAGGIGGDASYPGTDRPSGARGGEAGISRQIIDHDGTGGAGPEGNSFDKDDLERKAGSGPGAGGGGWGGGGGGDVTFTVVPNASTGSGTGGGGGGSFSYSEGTGWSAGSASPGGKGGWVRISWDPGGMLPMAVAADGTVNANVQSGWVNGGATTSNGMRWTGRGKIGASGIIGAVASGDDLIAVAKDGSKLQAYSSADAGLTWKAAGALPSGITWAGVDATDDVVVVASTDGKVAYSADAGATWKTTDTGLSKLAAIDRVPGVDGGFAAVGGSQVAFGAFAGGALDWQLDTAASPGKDLVVVAGVGPAVVVADQATGTASTKAATVGTAWHTTTAPLPHHGSLVGAAGTDTAIAVPGIEPDGIVGSVVVIDATSSTPNIDAEVKVTDAGTWPATGVSEIHEEGTSSTNRPALIQQCQGIFYIANGASSTDQAQVWTSADVPAQPVVQAGWLTGEQGTVPADVVAITC